MPLSADPRDGARRAFFAIHPNATDTDWEAWEAKLPHQFGGEIERYQSLAALCNKAIEVMGDALEPSVSRHICFSAGYYEAMTEAFTILKREAFA